MVLPIALTLLRDSLNLVILRPGLVYGPYVDYGICAYMRLAYAGNFQLTIHDSNEHDDGRVGIWVP